MLNKKGFTLIECMFVMSVSVIMIVLSFYIRTIPLNHNVIINDISLFINQAKTHAMIYKEKVNIYFAESSIQVNSIHLNDSYELRQGHFSKHSFSYNENGHIVYPKSVNLYINNKVYKFVFQIGSGMFYVEK